MSAGTDSIAVPNVRVLPWVAVWGAVFVSSWGGNQFSPLLLMYEERAHYSSFLVTVFLGVYVLGLAPALLVAGSLSDRHGRRPLMLVGIASAVVGSGLLAFGPLGAGFLMAGRLFSGITVGIAMAVGNSWVKELSQGRFDPSADAGSGARRASLAFTLGSASGALVAGLIAQWGPIPEVLPFLVHICVAVPFAVVVWRTPETNRAGGLPGPWWRQLAVPSAGHRRFTRVVLVAAPWIFGSAAIGYGYLPTKLAGATGTWGLVFATATTVVALGVSSAVQPLAARVHSLLSARGILTAVALMTVGIAVVVVAIQLQSVAIGLVANVVIGLGIGIALVSSLLEVQRIAGPRDLAGLTGVFYAVAYAGFLAPAVIAAIANVVAVPLVLWVVVGLGVLSWLVIAVSSRRHIPA
ncbi:putative MFS family arabinose efflux permease [Curtobacterium flaccumfaciens]|uniref:Putative MFS family arabinose efflux permease n=1 Tax=Curtobacterium flaccumfaciens TaxID=2035 RepID=A0A4R6DG02_9MICO|nr:MFS transporter [Curtobacterium flaccumfaciens]TDN43430.1 putative MFS family arabinose efflux permease [Curtobacterium flaccumfaciens]